MAIDANNSPTKALWPGMLIGVLLTALLMFLLYLQASPAPIKRTSTQEAEPLSSSAAIVVQPTEKTERPEPTIPAKTVLARPIPRTAPPPDIPQNLSLTEQEVADLSPQERLKYQEIQQSYQAIRDRVLRLHQEREQLKQRMDQMLEQNTEMGQQLDKIRQVQ